jgi:hypothetical protein
VKRSGGRSAEAINAEGKPTRKKNVGKMGARKAKSGTVRNKQKTKK